MEYKTILTSVIIFLIIILIITFLVTKYAEHLGSPIFLDQMSMAYSDPIWFNYSSREADVSGMDKHDYYLENQMNASTDVGPQYFEGDKQFQDHTNYMSMPIKYRPLRGTSASASQKLAEIHSNDMEENLYLDLNRSGHF